MSGTCSFCLEPKAEEETRQRFRCPHLVCGDCEALMEAERVVDCSVDGCRRSDWCRHGARFIGYCADDCDLVCQFCLATHEGHDLRDLLSLERDFKRERDKAYTENFAIVAGLAEDCQRFGLLARRVKEKAGQVASLALKSEARLNEFELADKMFKSVGFDPMSICNEENLPLDRRTALLRYLDKGEDYLFEMVSANQAMEAVNTQIEKRMEALTKAQQEIE